MALNDEIADARQQEQQTPKVESEEEQMTQDFEEAPAIKKEAKKKVEKPKEEKKVTPQPKPNPQPPAEKPREVNRKALFPGRTAGSTAASDGTGKGAGNQGNLGGRRVCQAARWHRHCRVPITGHATKDAWWSKFSSTVMVA